MADASAPPTPSVSLVMEPAVPGADEDAAGSLGSAAVLVDGAGLPASLRAGCAHSVAWYSHLLAARLLGALQDPALSLREALRLAIAEVAAAHGPDCRLEDGSPSATVVAVRWGAERLEHLVLADSSLLLDHADGRVERRTDPRVDEVVAAHRTVAAVEARRNAPGGFWVARHEPAAAEEAWVGSVPLTGLRAVHLVSDGVTRAIDLLGLHTASTLSDALLAAPDEVIAQVRAVERELSTPRRPRKIHDDATALTLSW